MKKYLSAQSTSFKLTLGILLLIILAGTLFIVGIIIGNALFGVDTSELQRLASSGARADIVRYMIALQAVALFIAPSACIAFMFRNQEIPFLRFKKISSVQIYLIAGAAILLSLPFINLLAELNRQLIDGLMGTDNWMALSEANAKRITEALLLNSEWSSLFLNIGTMALIPAISEELFFRGTIQGLIERGSKNVHIAVIGSALLFSAMHVQFYGFIPRAAMGIFMGYLYIWYRSLWLPIVVHFVNNSAAVILYFLIQREYVPQWVENIGDDTTTIGLSFASFACVMYAIVILAKRAKISLALKLRGTGPMFKL